MKLGGNKNWLKSADMKGGEVVTFTTSGEWVESTFKNPDGSLKNQFVIGVNVNGQDKDMSLNKTNRTELIKAFGDETADWVGRSATINKMKVMVSGEVKDTIILVPCTGNSAKGEVEEVPTDEVPF